MKVTLQILLTVHQTVIQAEQSPSTMEMMSRLLRRMNFQTPGMLSHPPIPVSQLSTHIEELKVDGATKFTAEYESIEPGQQFTWDNSSMDINKPKNRYDMSVVID